MTRQKKIEKLETIGKVVICNQHVYVKRSSGELRFNSVNEAHIYFFGY